MRKKQMYIINRMDFVDMGEPIGEIYRPYLAGLTHFDDINEDYWDVVYSHDHVDGVAESALVTIYTTKKNHDILEADPDIERVDDKADLKNKIKSVNDRVDSDKIEKKFKKEGR